MRMRKLFIAFVLALVATFAHAADDPPAIVGRLSYIAGPVSFAPGDADDQWSAAVLNRPITSGDRLWTDYGGRAEMHVSSVAIRLAARTSLDALNIDDTRVQLGLATGTINVRVRWLPPGTTFEVDTPQGAAIFTEPGSYRLAIDTTGNGTTVVVRAGRLDVLSPNERFSVGRNQRATMSATDWPPYDVSSAPVADEFDRWCANRDRAEENLAAAQYVPPGMTGYEDLDRYGAWQTAPEYGAIWMPATVPADWAPYRHGHWVWISPWGWSWVDDALWGFAPFHYGRWIWYSGRWAWAPGPRDARPVYAPALVAFIGGPGFAVSVRSASLPAVAWVPLGWHEPFVPWYRTTPTYVRNINVSHVTNINVTNINVANINYANRAAPSGVTVVPREQFITARRIEPLLVSPAALSNARATSAAPVAGPQPSSFVMARPAPKPPTTAITREVIGVHPPALRVERPGAADVDASQPFAAQRRPVRVIGMQRPAGDAARGRAERAERDATQPLQMPGAPQAGPSRSAPPMQQSDRPRSPAAAQPAPPQMSNAPAAPRGTTIAPQSPPAPEHRERPQPSARAVPSEAVQNVPRAGAPTPAPVTPRVEHSGQPSPPTREAPHIDRSPVVTAPAPSTQRHEAEVRRDGPAERPHAAQQAVPQQPQPHAAPASQTPPQRPPQNERPGDGQERGRAEHEHSK